MQLIADRFVEDEHGQVYDLATGERVCLVVSTAGGPGEQMSWAERCAWLSSAVHPALAPLLDYGALGESRRFEAWGAAPARADGVAGRHARQALGQFLSANGRAPLDERQCRPAERDGRVVVVPDAAAGLLREEPGQGAALDVADATVLGLVHEPDRRLAPLLELLASQQSTPVPAVGVWCPCGASSAAIVRQVARAARLGGRVPVDAPRLDSRLAACLRGRSLVVLTVGDPSVAWWGLLQAALESARPHMACFVGARAITTVHTVSVERVSAEALVRSVRPPQLATPQLRRVTTAARRAQGLRARFAQLLFGHTAARVLTRSESGPVPASRAAEDLGVERLAVRAADGPGRAWPAPGEVLRLRKQLDTVRALLTAGRLRPAERLARQVMHALARRSEWGLAVEGAVLLGQTFRRKGRCAQALEVVAEARQWSARARDLPVARQLVRLQADLLVDDGQLASAEALFEPLLAEALGAGDGAAVDVALASTRCLLWQGRYAEGWQRLALLPPEAGPASAPGSAVQVAMARSALARAQGRISDAVALAAHARDQAQTLDAERWGVAALETCAEVQLAAGDATQALATLHQALTRARAAHDPALTLRLRLLRAEAARRLGQRGPAVALVARCSRLRREALPGTIRARVDLLRDLLDAPDPAAAAERRAEAAGLPALRLYAPAPSPPTSAGSTTVDDIVHLLQCCQVAQEDRAVLSAVCARLRARLGAAGVAFMASESAQAAVVSADGVRPEAALAHRVLTANQLVLPHEGPERAEAGVPVRYAGQVVGALVAVWMPAARWHAADVSILLSTGATAAGPALAGLLTSRLAERRARTSELVGVSAAASEIRSAIDRAAGAPFAVLIEGESGSGKELVARLLHKLGPRRDRPFCTLNCAALPDELVESELFGHARGAFTGAAAERRGVFEEAHGGTLFLDEVGELSPRAQAKLLRAIQEGEIRRVGENSCRRVDVRLVTATNRGLRAEAAAGRFRSDLLYRLDVLRIEVPPLRERRDDIPLLVEHLWRDAAARVGSQASLAPATIAALVRHDWPGNIRELQNVLSALVVRCPRRGVVPSSALPLGFTSQEPSVSLRLDAARLTFDRAFIRAALVRTGGRRTRAARELGMSRQGLAKLMARLELEPGDDSGARPSDAEHAG